MGVSAAGAEGRRANRRELKGGGEEKRKPKFKLDVLTAAGKEV